MEIFGRRILSALCANAFLPPEPFGGAQGHLLVRLFRCFDAEHPFEHTGGIPVLHEGGSHEDRLCAGLSHLFEILGGAKSTLRDGQDLFRGYQR